MNFEFISLVTGSHRFWSLYKQCSKFHRCQTCGFIIPTVDLLAHLDGIIGTYITLFLPTTFTPEKVFFDRPCLVLKNGGNSLCPLIPYIFLHVKSCNIHYVSLLYWALALPHFTRTLESWWERNLES